MPSIVIPERLFDTPMRNPRGGMHRVWMEFLRQLQQGANSGLDAGELLELSAIPQSVDHSQIAETVESLQRAMGDYTQQVADLRSEIALIQHGSEVVEQRLADIAAAAGQKEDAGPFPSFDTGRFVPSGLIAMWSGLLIHIPAGWHLCDGTLGTPDLRSSFVKGSAAGIDPGVTGGAATHAHELPMCIDTGEVPKDIDYMPETTFGTGTVRNFTSHQLLPLTTSEDLPAMLSESVSSEPVFYSLAFIMKT